MLMDGLLKNLKTVPSANSRKEVFQKPTVTQLFTLIASVILSVLIYIVLFLYLKALAVRATEHETIV